MFVSNEFQAVLQALDAGRDNDGLAKVPFKSRVGGWEKTKGKKRPSKMYVHWNTQ
jgi:hypothetical protein